MTGPHTVAHQALRALRLACWSVGLDPRGAELLRLGENAVYRLSGNIVARVGRVGQSATSAKEVNVAHWLESADVPAVRAIRDIDQPVDVDGRPVTFWRELPPHEHGTPTEVAAALRCLHGLAPPTTFSLSPITPFVRLDERISGAAAVTEEERTWMREHLVRLRRRYADLPAGLPSCVVHGDAWIGNVVSTSDSQAVFLDLERTAIGPPEWDLVHTAIKHTSFGWISAGQYREFCEIYGHDVTVWAGFDLLRDIREFRMTCMAVQLARETPSLREQAAHRLACLRGDAGPRPWTGWHAVP